MIDRPLIWLTAFAVLAFICAIVMVANDTPIFLPTRFIGMQSISSIWLLAFIPIIYVPAYFFRNLGGIFSILGCGLIAGSSAVALISFDTHGLASDVTWLQMATSFFVVAAAIPGIARMNFDFSTVDVNDFFT